MAFNYNKHNGDDHSNFWTSYSDLLLGLSVVFLLLYVTASVRVGTNGIQQQLENQKLSMQVEDLKNQLKAYDSIKKEYLDKEASPDEEQMYNELMDKLTLLQEDAKDEKSKLEQAANEHAKKQKALNQYQQMVRNIINANTLAKTKISKRNTIIEDQDTEIEDQTKEITNLEQTIRKNEQKIAQTENQLDQQLKNLKKALKDKDITKAAYEKKVAALREESDAKVQNILEANEQIKNQLEETSKRVASLSGALEDTKGALENTKEALEAKEGEAKDLSRKLQASAGEYQQQLAALKGKFAEQARKDREAFEGALNKERLSAAERGKREAEYRAQVKAREKEYGDKLGALNSKLKDTEGNLARLKAEADARKGLASEIMRGFKAAGVKASVDGETGDVTLDFGENYFENDSAKLKRGMMDVLKKAMPSYARALMGNPKLADKITAVEIVGFASPTYKGKFIDPTSDAASDKEALTYNMDLSYRRAKSIFNYTFHDSQMSFEHQKQMLPMVKVSARSFLELFDQRRKPAGNQEFCKHNDCNKARRVMIRFNMDLKK